MTDPMSGNDEPRPESHRGYLKVRSVLQSFGKRRRTLLAVLGILVVLFAAMALLEQRLVHWQFNRTTYRELVAGAKQLSDQIAYKDKWDLKQYRNTPASVTLYNLVTSDGLIIDVDEVVPGLLGRVEQPNEALFQAPQTVTTSLGESWRILGKKLTGGYAIVAIPTTADVADTDAKLSASLESFGSTLKDAVAPHLRDVPAVVEYAVVSSNGDLKAAWGGVPLRTALDALPTSTDRVARFAADGRSYLLYSEPILNTLGKSVGTIIVGKDLSFEEAALGNYDRFNYGIVGGALVLVLALTFALLAWERSRQSKAVTLDEALKVGESMNVEFKSAFQWDFIRKVKNETRRLDTLKSIVGFLNAKGGTLFVGVTENTIPPSICGLDEDLRLVHGSKDELRLLLHDLITRRIGPEFSPFITDSIEEHEGRSYWSIVVDRSPVPAFVDWDSKDRFFVREGPKTSELDSARTWRYIKNRWG